MDQTITAGLPDAATPYILRAGEGTSLLVAGQVIRVLAGGAQSNNAFGIVICTAPADRQPIPMHFHEHEHDTWLCTRGRLRLWSGADSRILFPGDFGYVKPGDTHSYQSVAPHTEFFGVVAPGGWERFFFEAGEAYDDVIFPEPGRPFDFRRMGPAMGKYDVHVTPHIPFAELPAQAQDHSLPAEHSSYFLQAGFGQKRLLGGHLISAILTAAQSQGSLELHEFAAPSGTHFPANVTPAERFLHLLDGRLEITLGGARHVLQAGDSAAIPAGTALATHVTGRQARWLLVSNGDAVSAYLAGAAPLTAQHTWAAGGGPAIQDGDAQGKLTFL